MPRKGLRRKVTGGQLDVFGFSYHHPTYMLHCVCELCVAVVTIMFQSSNQMFSHGEVTSYKFIHHCLHHIVSKLERLLTNACSLT